MYSDDGTYSMFRMQQQYYVAEAYRNGFEEKCRAHFSKLFDNIEAPEALQPHLPAIMDEFHNPHRNTGYASVQKFCGRQLAEGFEGLLNYAEESFVIALFDTMQTPKGELHNQKMRNLQEVREQLAQLYADISQFKVSRDDPEPSNREHVKEALEGIMQGTVSAVMFNTLKEKKLIPDDTKAGKLYDGVEKGGVTR
jgi:hypothetical protein